MVDSTALPPQHPAYLALQGAFKVLAEIEPDLPAQAVAFVADGAGVEVLARLKGHRNKASLWLGKPGSIDEEPSFFSSGKDGMVQTARLSRRHFYGEVARSLELDGAILWRLARVLEAGDGGKTLVGVANGLPDWMHYLCHDLLCCSAAHAGVLGPLPVSALARRGATAGGLTALDFAVLTFERKGRPRWSHDDYLPLLDPPPVVALLDSLDAPTLETLVAQLAVEGRLVLVAFCAHLPLDGRYGAMLLDLMFDSDRAVRTESSRLLEKIDASLRRQRLGRRARSAGAGERERAVTLLGQCADAEVPALLEALRVEEGVKAVQAAIQKSLNKQQALAGGAALAPPPLADIAHLDGGRLGDSARALLEAARLALRRQYQKAFEQEVADNKRYKVRNDWARRRWESYQRIDADHLARLLDLLNGESDAPFHTDYVPTFLQALAIADLPEFGLPHLLRWFRLSSQDLNYWWNNDLMKRWLRRVSAQGFELRHLHRHCEAIGVSADRIAEAYLGTYRYDTDATDRFSDEAIWPFFVEQPQFLQEAMGLAPSQGQHGYARFTLANALDLLARFPQPPVSLLPVLFDLALGQGKTQRVIAQRLLRRLPDLLTLVFEALASPKQELRVSAASWLADIGDPAAVEPLLAALKTESRETARAAMLSALERLGVDIAPFVAPEVLLAEAKKGLKAKPPAGLSWFPLDALPPLVWADGTPVPVEIPKWWLILACKLKGPGGNPLLTRYLSLLAPDSSATLGRLALHGFIEQDILGPTPEEADAYAQAEAPGMLRDYQRMAKSPGYAHLAEITLEQLQQQLRREHLALYHGSAIGEKGILAFAAAVPGHEAVTVLQAYMRDHYRRRAQIEAMLEAVAGSDDPALIQLLLAVSRRHRTASVQEKARLLVDQIAARNDWSADQLGDRTIPSAGFDEAGVLTLEYGARALTVTLDEAMKPVLRDAAGKILKALPEARQDDDPEQVKEAKARFAQCKKELKQVLTLQTARLYDAMCVGRVWPAAEWRDYLLAHPVVGRLAQRLVWRYDDGEAIRVFRPVEDGSLTDVEDEAVELGEGSVSLAHAALLDAGAIQAWKKHCKDYKLKPLFDQLGRTPPALTDGTAEIIEDRLGWISDAFTLRSQFDRLGYRRGEVWDGACFYEYRKDYAAAGFAVVIEFSGNSLPEENAVAALKSLYFHRCDDRAFVPEKVALERVPSVLLAEAYGDYLEVAEACAGFDPEWETKIPW